MTFTISEQEVRERRKNILWGLVLSVALAGIMWIAHSRDPDRYNEMLLYSIIVFVVLANVVNYIGHLRYLRLSRDHRLEVGPDSVQFWTKGEVSELDLADIAALRFFKRRGRLGHIHVQLRNGRGIRLEGYGNMDDLKRLLVEQVPAANIMAD